MQRETYRMLVISISSFYAIKHCYPVESKLTAQEIVKATGLAKKCLLGNLAERHFGTTVTAAAIAGSIIGIGMAALPNELSSQEINSPDRLNISSIYETTNGIAVFGMDNENDREAARLLPSRQGCNYNVTMNPAYKDEEDESHSSSSSKSDTERGSHSSLSGRNNLGFFLNENAANSIPLPSSHSTGVNDDDANIGSENEQLKSDNDNVRVLIIQSSSNNDSDPQSQEIHKPEKTVTRWYSCHDIRTRWNLMTNIEKRNLIAKTTIGTLICFMGGILIAEIVLHATMTGTGDTKDICEPYKDIPVVCSDLKLEKLRCHQIIDYAFSPDRLVKFIPLPGDCIRTVNGIPIRVDLFNKFGIALNKGMQRVQNISSLDCAATLRGFNETILDIATTYKCDSHLDFQRNITKELSNTCNQLQRGTRKIFELCVTHKNLNHFANLRGEDGIIDNVIGALGKKIPYFLSIYTKIYDTAYFDKYYSRNATFPQN